MKLLIPILIGLLVVGCGKKEPTMEDKIVGTYEARFDGLNAKVILLENGKGEYYFDGKETGMLKGWKLVENEVHFKLGGAVSVYKIETNGDLTETGNITNGKREEYTGELRSWAKIK